MGGLLILAYVICIVGIVIYLMQLLGRFVGAHERIAASLDIIARKLKDENGP
jgi:hypothetical protein